MVVLMLFPFLQEVPVMYFFLFTSFVTERGEFTKSRGGKEKNKSAKAATIHVFSL